MKPWVSRLLFALVLFAGLAALCASRYVPPLPNPFTVDLVVRKGDLTQAGPLIVTGHQAHGDFLFVRRVDDTHLQLGYDSWSKPGVTSAPLAFTPGTPLRLTIAMPTLDQWHESLTEPPGRLKVTAAGQTVFAAESIHYYKHEPEELWLAENPLGGTACSGRLQARLLRPDGREWRGSAEEVFDFADRLAGWLRHSRQVYALGLLGLVMAAGWVPLAWFRPTELRAAAKRIATTWRLHRWFVGSALVASVIFGWMITRGTMEFFRTEEFATFYDFQMSALLHGRLDVTEDAISGEAFVFQGKLYGYFGPTPALLRLPFVFSGFAFGEMSRSLMLAYFAAALIASYLLLRHALRLLGRADIPSPFATVLLVFNVGLGSTLFFLASRAYVYHEAILCGAALALFSALFALRHLAEPAVRRWWLWSLICGVLSLHARPPTGLFALTLLGCVSAAHLISALRQRKVPGAIRHAAAGVFCVLGVFTFNGLSYLKFKSFEGAPLHLSRPYNAERLAHIEGKNFHLVNLPYGLYTYFYRANIRVESGFPWLYLGADTPGHYFTEAKIDLPDHTNALPWTMPGLFWLAALGSVAAWGLKPSFRSALTIVGLSALPMTLALCAAIAAAQRYTGDFVPFLVCAAVFGLVLLDQAPNPWRVVLRSVLAAATLFAIVLTFAMTLHHQRQMVWGVPENFRQEYQQARQRIDRFFHANP